MNNLPHSQQWHTLPTPLLLEQANQLTQHDQDSPAARCISALIWRLRGSEEWIASLQARCEAR